MAHRTLELDEQGYRTIFDLTEDVLLGGAADRQRRAVQTGQIIVDPGLADALAGIAPPVAFLDFETVGLAIPVWNGCHPYDQVPVQFSCHVEDAAGHVTHHAWLAEGPADPRPALAERLVTACAAAHTIVAYHAPFERQCIVQLAEAVPALAAPLGSIAERLVDLLPIIRNHVYHPDFGGSFSLKRVLPALVPEARYDGPGHRRRAGGKPRAGALAPPRRRDRAGGEGGGAASAPRVLPSRHAGARRPAGSPAAPRRLER